MVDIFYTRNDKTYIPYDAVPFKLLKSVFSKANNIVFEITDADNDGLDEK